MITVIAEHSVDITLLPDKANILDLGCRGFLFSDEMKRLGFNVAPVDVDDLGSEKWYIRAAATNINGGYVKLIKSNDPQATRIKQSDKPTSISSYTINGFCGIFGLESWDLIKIDIEGSEYEVIMSLTEPPAKQLSIEFHLHTKIYGEKEMREMDAKLSSLGYEAVSHVMTSQHGMGMNYWDSLFILK
jgi:FkbM family methyltransferase